MRQFCCVPGQLAFRHGIHKLAIGTLAIAMLSGAATAAGPTAAPTAPDTSTLSAPTDVNSWTSGTSVMRNVPGLDPAVASLDDSDHRATLEAIQYALTEVADGASFVWRRQKGVLSGTVKPTTSFRDGAGRICRHIELALTAGSVSREMEGIACRGDKGAWSLAS